MRNQTIALLSSPYVAKACRMRAGLNVDFVDQTLANRVRKTALALRSQESGRF